MTVEKRQRKKRHISPIRDKVISALRQHGPMTTYQVHMALDHVFSERTISQCISMSRRKWPGEFFRIHGWEDPLKSQKPDRLLQQWSAIYNVGGGADCPRPSFDKKNRANHLRRERRKKNIQLYLVAERARKRKKAKEVAGIVGCDMKPKTYNPWQGMGAR